MKLTHPDAPRVVVETRNPEAYVSQGWVEVAAKKSDETPDPQ